MMSANNRGAAAASPQLLPMHRQPELQIDAPYHLVDDDVEETSAVSQQSSLFLALPTDQLEKLYLRVSATNLLVGRTSPTSATTLNMSHSPSASPEFLASAKLRRRLPSSWLLAVCSFSGSLLIWEWIISAIEDVYAVDDRNTGDGDENRKKPVSDVATTRAAAAILGVAVGSFIFAAFSRHHMRLQLEARLAAHTLEQQGGSRARSDSDHIESFIRRRQSQGQVQRRSTGEGRDEQEEDAQDEDENDGCLLLSVHIAIAWQIYICAAALMTVYFVDAAFSNVVRRAVKYFDAIDDGDASSTVALDDGVLLVFFLLSSAHVAATVCLSGDHTVSCLAVVWSSACAGYFSFQNPAPSGSLSAPRWHFVVFCTLLPLLLYLGIARPQLRAAKASFLADIRGRDAAADAHLSLLARMSQKANPFRSSHLRAWTNVVGGSFSFPGHSETHSFANYIDDDAAGSAARRELINGKTEPWNVSERFLTVEPNALPLAGGAAGQVFTARYHSVPVAIKEVFATAVDRFETRQLSREVEILARLSHPRIVQLFGMCKLEQSSKIVLVMELLPRSLSIALQGNRGPHQDSLVSPSSPVMSPESLVSTVSSGNLYEWEKQRIAIQVVEACLFLERLSICHRDIKPANILLTTSNDAKLCDFGSAVQLKHGSNHPSVNGTAGYAAPECVRAMRRSRQRQQSPPDTFVSPLRAAVRKHRAERKENDIIDWVKADVFSVGMCVAAMFSPEGDPFPDQKSASAVGEAVLSGSRPSHFVDPEGSKIEGIEVPEWARSVAVECWANDAAARPTFAEIEQHLCSAQEENFAGASRLGLVII